MISEDFLARESRGEKNVGKLEAVGREPRGVQNGTRASARR
jgi:hypothetical protein